MLVPNPADELSVWKQAYLVRASRSVPRRQPQPQIDDGSEGFGQWASWVSA